MGVLIWVLLVAAILCIGIGLGIAFVEMAFKSGSWWPH